MVNQSLSSNIDLCLNTILYLVGLQTPGNYKKILNYGVSIKKISLITINKLKLIANANKYNPIVNNWKEVLAFAKKVTFVLSDKLFLAE